jgi:hypothetical protein
MPVFTLKTLAGKNGIVWIASSLARSFSALAMPKATTFRGSGVRATSVQDAQAPCGHSSDPWASSETVSAAIVHTLTGKD